LGNKVNVVAEEKRSWGGGKGPKKREGEIQEGQTFLQKKPNREKRNFHRQGA